MAQQPNLSELMKTAQKMQESMRKAQEEMENMKIDGKAGSEPVIVTATLNGKKRLVRIKISEQAYKEGIDVLEGLIEAAFNDAERAVEKAIQQKMMEITKNVGLPEDFGKEE